VDSISILDGTLREGEQTPGVFFTKEEKIGIARELDRAGVQILDVGMPSVSKEERDTIKAIVGEDLSASIGVSARLRREEVEQARGCGAGEIFLICPVSPIHLKSKLGMTGDEVTRLTRDMIIYAVRMGLRVNLVAEDASRACLPFLCELCRKAGEWGAKRAFICDTVGIMEPDGMERMVKKLRESVPCGMELGVHCHNDLGLATANTLTALKAGASCPSVTVNGIGERAGNAPLHEVALGIDKFIRRPHGIDTKRVYDLSRLVERCSGIFLPPHTPIVGKNSFRHESGIHVDGILKDKEIYTGIDPAEVNRKSAFVLGKHTGTGTIRHLLKERGYEAHYEQLQEILRKVKERKIREGKKDIIRMAVELEKYYERCLGFSEAVFMEIVQEVLSGDG